MGINIFFISPLPFVFVIKGKCPLKLALNTLVELAFSLFYLFRTWFIYWEARTNRLGAQLLILSFKIFLTLHKRAKVGCHKWEFSFLYFSGYLLKV
jgi:hypothetical protein